MSSDGILLSRILPAFLAVVFFSCSVKENRDGCPCVLELEMHQMQAFPVEVAVWAEEFRADRPDLVMTVEASGIALAVATAHALGDLPVVFAKKSPTRVQNADQVQARVYSFTHQTENMIRVEKKYLPAGCRVLIIDDFLADGEATHGMMELCEKQRATVVGVGIAIEKGFQGGGDALRAKGIRVESLATIDSMTDKDLTFRRV